MKQIASAKRPRNDGGEFAVTAWKYDGIIVFEMVKSTYIFENVPVFTNIFLS
ncbi:MAG: hypothetical protein ACKVJF_10550 [Flavobacteriales bacterium]